MPPRSTLLTAGLVGAAWCCCAGCADAPRLSWRLTFEREELADRARVVEVDVLEGGCAGRPLFSSRVTIEGDGPAPGKLPAGRYGFRGRARNEACEWYAEGCVELALPRRATIELVLGERHPYTFDPNCEPVRDDADEDHDEAGDARRGADDRPDDDDDDDDSDATSEESSGAPFDAIETGPGRDDARPADAAPAVRDDVGGVPDDARATEAADASGAPGAPDGGGDAELGDALVANDAAAAFDPSAPKCRGLDRSVVACFDFDGSLTDLSGHGHDAIGLGATFEPGLAGLAVRVGGSRVSVADAAALNFGTFTIEIWLRSDGLGSLSNENDDRTILIDKNGQYFLGYEPTGAARLAVLRSPNNGAAIRADDRFALVPGAWTYLVAAYDGSVAFLYLDGARIESRNVGITLSAGDGAPLHVGSGSPDVTRTFDGLIDALRISNVARGDAAICAEAGKSFVGGRCE